MNAQHSAPLPPRRWRWLRRIGIGALLMALVVGALIAWLLYTVGGRNTLLGRVQALLPAGSLSWQRADGVLSGPLTLYGVHYRHNGVDLRARRVMLIAALRPLFDQRLQLLSLEVDNATLYLAIDRKPKPLPSWPGSLPKFAIPFVLSADSVRVRDLRVSREGIAPVHVRSLDGRLQLAPGVLVLRDVVADTDRGALRANVHIDVQRNYRVQIKATAQLPALDATRTGAQLRINAGGDLDHFVLALDGRAPLPFALKLVLDDGRAQPPRWSLDVIAPKFDPTLLEAPQAADRTSADGTNAIPYAIALQATGHGGRASVQGRVARGDRVVVVAPSQLAYENGVVEAQPLALKLLDGSLILRGRVDLRPASPLIDATAALDGLRWSAATNASSVAASGKLTLAGTIDAWRVAGTLDLLRDRKHANAVLVASGDRSSIRFERFDARTPAGAMAATGQLRWSPQRAWSIDATLSGFDPGYFAPGFEGAVSGRVRSDGGIDANGMLNLHASAEALSGQLRGRRLGGRGNVEWKAGMGRADIDLRIGASHVQASGAFGRALDLLARFDPLRLDDVLPDAQGTLAGQVSLKGDPQSPSIAGHLTGVGLHWRTWGAAHAVLDGNLQPDAQGALRIDADGVAGVPGVASLHLRIDGSERNPHVAGDLDGSLGAFAINGSAVHQGAAWTGNIASLRYTPVHGAAWTLAAPTAFRYESPQALRLQHMCMSSGGASICADADWPHRANLQAHALPVSLLDPWIARPDIDVRAYGSVDLDAHIAPAAHGGWTGSAVLHSGEGGLQLQPKLPRPLLGYSNLVAHATLEGGRVQVQVDSALDAGGSVHAQIATGIDASAPLSGNVDFHLQDITWLELFSTDIAAPKGHIDGRIALAGVRAHPLLSGHASLLDLQAELPALGIAIKEGHIELAADPGGAARISGSLRSGEGVLAIGGALTWNDSSAPLTVTLKGTNVRVADTPELSAVVSPDLQLGYAAGTLKLRGKVDVAHAQMNLERLDNTVWPSPDVVVLDPIEKEQRHALAVDVDFALAMGDDVKLKGFGLNGKLGGQLRVRSMPGTPMTATGALEVSGRYAAYGQQLEIVRGRLAYNGGGFDNPVLDILAQREFDNATVGVRVRGTALRPQTQITSTPAMDPSNALAYLVIGRPLNQASADEGRQIGAAAAALSVGGNLIAQKVGARLGLDTAGVSESRALGGTTFTVGKYLSPRLLLSYGVSLVGSGEVLTLKYLLRKGLDVQFESGRENRASINYRIEK